MKILITGGLGFIGSNLLNNLVKKKTVEKIIIIDNFSKSDLSNLSKDIKFKYYASSRNYCQSRSRIDIIRADINDQKLAIKLTKGIDYVVHLAAESGVDISIKNPQEAFNINVKSTFNYIEASRINKVKSLWRFDVDFPIIYRRGEGSHFSTKDNNYDSDIIALIDRLTVEVMYRLDCFMGPATVYGSEPTTEHPFSIDHLIYAVESIFYDEIFTNFYINA